MIEPDKQKIQRSLGREKLLVKSGLRLFSNEEQKKLEEVKPIIMNLFAHIIENEVQDYLNSIYEKDN